MYREGDIVLPRGRFPHLLTSDWVRNADELAIEIGIGAGHFLAALTERHPEWSILGIDVAPTSIARSYRKLARLPARRVRLAKADARLIMRDFLPQHSIDRIYVNFPDPWPRKRHRDRRLLQQRFFALAASRLRDGGRLLLTTDQEPYLDESLGEAEASGYFSAHRGHPPPETLATKYASKWESRGSSFFHATFVRTAEPSVFPSQYHPVDVHHAILSGSLPAVETSLIGETFENGRIVLKDLFPLPDRDQIVFLFHIEEELLAQEILVQVKSSQRGYFVGLKRFGEPLPTAGIARAVDVAVGLLEERGMEVLHRKY